jgi:uncharacterized membrane protein YkgB
MDERLARIGRLVLRYGLVVLVLWFGVFKFTDTEARAIEPLLRHSPVLSWLYAVTDVPGASRLIGLAEIAIALSIALYPAAPRLAAIGSFGAIGMFLTTLSFLVTTPGMWAVVEGVPAPAGSGGFILKDVVLLGAAFWTAHEALAAWTGRREAAHRAPRALPVC